MHEDQTSAAEQRAFAVAKLKRAASLPRMKDGRRPPMHVEAVSEGEKGQSDDDKKDAETTPPPEPVEEPVQVVEEEPVSEVAQSPEVVTRAKRRSRSRSRSRGSKDLKGKLRAAQSPTPTSQINGDYSSQDEAPVPPPILTPVIPPLMQPIPSHFQGGQRSRLLYSPATSPDVSQHPGTSPPTPILKTLDALQREALQRGLFRSNSAGSVSAGRRLALMKLTGEMDTSPSPTPPPMPQLGRNNTVSGGERSAARQIMLTRLGGRITREAESEREGEREETTSPSSTPKRRRRRSRRGSASANAGISDSEFLSTSPNTPIVPPTPLPMLFDNLPDLRAASATPNHLLNYPDPIPPRNTESPSATANRESPIEPGRPERQRRRSVVVEEEEDSPPLSRPSALPPIPRRTPPATTIRIPHGSDAPSQTSTDSASPSAIGVPIYLSASQRTPSRHVPSSPFTTPLKEKASRDEDEEQVLYPAETHRPRTPYEDNYEREISWVASPVPEIRMPVDDEEEEEEEEDDYGEPPLSARSSNLSPNEAYDDNDTSPRASSGSKDLVVESEASPETTPSYVPPSPSSVAALSHTASITRASDDSVSSPQIYPARLSVASRMQSDRSPLNLDVSDWDDRAANESKRNGDGGSTSAWEKVKGAFARGGSSGGRRSRTNSIMARERRDHTDSSISRESGASLTSAKTDKGEPISAFAYQQAQQPLMQSPSASASILSLAPHQAPRGGVSPVPPASSADLLKYQNAKLFPFPGMKALEEQRNRAKGFSSASSPDVSLSPNGVDDDHSPHASTSSGSNPAQTPMGARDRKLSQQASDTRLLAKYNIGSPPISATPSTGSHPDYFDIMPQSPPSSGLKLPMTLPGVKQWLSKNNRKLFSSTASTPQSPNAPTSPPVVEVRLAPTVSKKASLSDLLRIRKEADLAADWEEIASEKSRTPTSASGSTLLGKQPIVQTEVKEGPREHVSNGVSSARAEHTDTEKTPKATKMSPPVEDAEASYLQFDISNSALSSPPDPPSSTPDPLSSLDDYPAHSTSSSASSSSSEYSQHVNVDEIPSQGAVVLGRLEESLARGSRSPMWADALDGPARRLLLSSPVLQVVNSNTVKDRFLFLFNDIFIIAKPVVQDQENLIDTYKPSPLDRKYIVKSVVLLHQLRFSSDRVEPQMKSASYTTAPRNPLIRPFVHQFTKDPDSAISTLFTKAGIPDDPVVLGQLLFRTLELDRARLGDYLSRKTSRLVLKTYIDSFGFTGMRADRALRVFLYSINIPPRTATSHSALEYLLDAFASRWYEANAGIVAYDKDLAIRLVRSLVQLNDALYEGIAQEPGPTGYPRRNVTAREFLDAFRRYDVRYLVPDEVLEEIYESVRREKLYQARNPLTAGMPDIPIVIKRALPTRLTYKVQSDPIILRIPQADPQLTIQLFGKDLVFDPPVLNFAKSSEASFRVMGTSLGSKSMIMCRSGPNALRYWGLPLSNPLVVERAFMRNTFQVAFLNHQGVKRRYMFSVDDPLIRHQWTVSLKREIETATASAGAPVNGASPSKFHRAAEHVAFKVLQETLIGSEAAYAPPPSAIDKALHSLNGSPRHAANGSTSRAAASPGYGRANGRTGPAHVRSKSRSQVYHEHGPGKNELDLHSGVGSDDEARGAVAEAPARVEGRLWSGRDLELQCQQNSSIALVLSYLQIGAPDAGGS